MNIWDILGIEPTAEIKTIKKAYAAKSRIIHPEENPEEFQVLYKAYQSALRQAKEGIDKMQEPPLAFGSQASEEADIAQGDGEAFGQKSGQETEQVHEEEQEEDELRSYLIKNRKQEDEKLARVTEYWKDAWKKYRRPEERERLKDYLNSDEFQEIQWHPQAVHLLVEELQKPVYYSYDEMWMHLWELYGFREEEKDAHQGDVKKLRSILYTYYKRRQKEADEKEIDGQKRQEKIRQRGMWKRVRLAVLIILCIAAPVLFYFGFTYEQHYILKYMTEKYPGVEFSGLEKGERDEEGRMRYHFTASAYPDFRITAAVQYGKYGLDKRVIEDYGSQLLGHYAKQYDLTFGLVEGSHTFFPDADCPGALYYSDPSPEQLEEFCAAVIRMFQEQEELQCLDAVGICMEGARYPEIMLRGGDPNFSVPAQQTYRPLEMTAEEMAEAVREAYIEYMFNYEPWKLTLRQYLELGPIYKKMCWRWGDYDKHWLVLYDFGEERCDLCIRTFEVIDSYHYRDGREEAATTTWISIGNAYHYLIAQGAKLTVLEDGTGFEAEYEGETEYFGEEPYLVLRMLDSEAHFRSLWN